MRGREALVSQERVVVGDDFGAGTEAHLGGRLGQERIARDPRELLERLGQAVVRVAGTTDDDSALHRRHPEPEGLQRLGIDGLPRAPRSA